MSQTLQIPVAGSQNTRVGALNILGAVSGVVGAGVVGVMTVGRLGNSSTKDQRWINCFSETITDAITGKSATYTVKRPGFGVALTPAAGQVGTALAIWTGKGGGTEVISAFGGTNSTIYSGTTSLGAITGKATGISETFVSAVPTLLISSSDNTGWYHATTVPTKITDADFPGNAGRTLAGTFAHMDGYTFIMDTLGQLWASDLNSVTGWTATSFDSASAYPDIAIGCVRHRNLILCFGRESVEFFYNAGTTPFPLSKNPSMTQRIGCCSAEAISQIGDTLFWAGSSPQGGLSVFQYDGGLSRVSTPEVDSILILAGAANIRIACCRFYGRSFVVVSAATTTLVYCVEERQWTEWISTIAPWHLMVGISVGDTMTTYGLSKTSTTGSVFFMAPNALVFRDNGAAYTATMQLDSMDLGATVQKTWEALTIIGDVQSATSPVQISYSDDDYETTSTWGTLDLVENLPQARRLGSSRRRAWILAHEANTPMRIRALELKVTLGDS